MNNFEAPKFLEMVRSNDPNITEQDAETYVQSSEPELTNKKAATGCYIIKCMRPCVFPVACAYNLSCDWCLWPGLSTIPFGCFIVLSGSDERGHYVNIKGDTVIMKVDEENETLACFGHNSQKSGKVCCYCNKY